MATGGKSFIEPDLTLTKVRQLGVGSYGSVYIALYGDLVCAAKFMHSVLFQFTPKGKPPMVQRFEEECDLLRCIRHPCIVQFLDKTTDPDTGLPVLLMELMDESLTHYLEKLEQPPLYHLQVNLCHDVCMALSYLHSANLIHRDVSGNNVLLTPSFKAKLSDFGVSTLMSKRDVEMTQCPGALVYMPPEGQANPPKYSEKMDVFSFGVIGVQIATCSFPNPGDAYRTVSMPRLSATSNSQHVFVCVPEVERRENHITMISDDHHLKASFLSCLKDDAKERPSAHKLCELLLKLKESTAYVESVQLSKLHGSSSLQTKCEAMTRRLNEFSANQTHLNEALQNSEEMVRSLSSQVNEQRQVVASLEQENRRLQALQTARSSQVGDNDYWYMSYIVTCFFLPFHKLVR